MAELSASNSPEIFLVKLVNSRAFRKPMRSEARGVSTAKEPTSWSTGTLSSSVTSRFDSRACSANAMRFSRRFCCLISGARASSVSRSPYSVMSWAPVLTPMPGTPGTLSTLSPASACTSTTLSGLTPNFSRTASSPSSRSFIVSRSVTPLRTSCIKSLSDDTMRQVAPASTAWRA